MKIEEWVSKERLMKQAFILDEYCWIKYVWVQIKIKVW